MRFALSLTALLLGSAAHADDILIRADISAATVYLSGADVTRSAEVTLPAGAHRLLIAMPDAAQADRLAVAGPGGLTLGPIERISGYAIAEGALDDDAQAGARADLEAAEEALRAAEDTLAGADGAIRALEAQMAYLTALTRGGSEGATMPADPAVVAQALATLGTETARVQAEVQAARVERRILAEAVTDAQVALAAASDALARLQPLGTAVDVIAVPVLSAEQTEGVIRLDYLTYGAGWEPSYEIRLDSETGALELARFITAYAAGPGRWQGVQMSFSTAEPNRRRVPSVLSPTPARIVEPPPPGSRADDGAGFSTSIERLLEPEAVPVIEAAMAEDRAALRIEGLSVRYDYETPVSIGPSGEAVLPLDALTLQAETEARAVPRFDETAFLVATATNESAEPILPGYARFYRDGALVGEDLLPLIAAGAEAEMAFGPLDHLRLVWIDRSLAEGDRGVFTTASTQERRIAFGVENTSDQAETVRLLYATPFAEQEDLGLELALTPAPGERDVDDLRGVHAWSLAVAPGETALVEMEVSLDWPEDQRLTWRP
ncbi:mucoidy inhibitor MuiA family protein [Rhodobacterales bacterium HKCCSP123]|nr:mucoidy inhibitor MuiA family protein [Rhodobacterales bacterium HKCCSP123]